VKRALVVVVAALVLGLVAGCAQSANTGESGDSAIVGEIVGILTYGTTWDYMPPNNTPVPRTTLESYHAAMEDEDGKLFLLTAPDMSSDFEYDGMFLSGVTTTVAGYTYTDQAPFNDESRVVGGKSRDHQPNSAQVHPLYGC
jgi:hypothetical protein